MRKVFVHLHPDFSNELNQIFKLWNRSQTEIEFIGVVPQQEIEIQLLKAGMISLTSATNYAKEIRNDNNGTYQDGIIVFTEKRLFTDVYYQLFSGGTERELTISLDFLRQLFPDNGKSPHIFFRVVLNIILNAVFQSYGFTSHDDTRGCLLDFCNYMPDILQGVENGPKLCYEDFLKVKKQKKEFLLDLINITASFTQNSKIEEKVTKKIYEYNNREYFQNEDNEPIDFAIVIALKEEFNELYPIIKGRVIPFYAEEYKQQFYLFSASNSRPRNCVATFIGDMGLESALQVTEWIITKFNPTTIVNIGIAASMDDKVLLGDVIIGEQIENYLHNAKVVDLEIAKTNRYFGKNANSTTTDFKFIFSNESYPCTPDYINQITNICFTNEELYQDWILRCEKSLFELLGDNNKFKKTFFHERPEIISGNIASGPILCSSKNFKKIIKDYDRKFIALEMESGGVMKAINGHDIKSIVIRGISDFAEGNKAELDGFNDGAIRRYAMNNSLSLFWILIDILP